MDLTEAPSIVWFRNDLRLADNEAVLAAVKRGAPIVPAFIYAPEEEGEWPPGAASRWWLHHSLSSLKQSLAARGLQLVLRQGSSLQVLLELLRETGARAVFANARYEPSVITRDRKVQEQLRAAGWHVEYFDPGLLTDPLAVRNSSGKPFQVFTAFWRSCLQSIDPPPPPPPPRKLRGFGTILHSLPLEAFELLPTINWAAGFLDEWKPGELGAIQALKQFCATALEKYRLQRDYPAIRGTSRLSPHLHFGEITARQVWHAIRQSYEPSATGQGSWKNSQFVAELGWREFAHHLLCHFPKLPTRPLRQEFERFPWNPSPALAQAWQRGRTGYPIVDAGMRQLWTTGWMHNRVRMMVGSFFVKDLLVPWQEGARWFWDTLVDADLANNTLGWQWVAGCGADAAPFFRIFNPVSQGERFDPQGEYVRGWVPELASMPAPWIHKPWQAPLELLQRSKVVLGTTYPRPVVDHAKARAAALAAFGKWKATRLSP